MTYNRTRKISAVKLPYRRLTEEELAGLGALLKEVDGNMSEVARRLNVHRRVISQAIKEHTP